MISFAEALQRLETVSRLTKTETLPLSLALGRTLAKDVSAILQSPLFTNSAMDGFAFLHADGLHLKIGATIHAGPIVVEPALHYQPKTAVRIMTGAAVPNWADTVIAVENTELLAEGREVRFLRAVERGASIRYAGEDIKAGEKLFEKGLRLAPHHLMTAANFGIAQVEVLARPAMALFSTGDELVEVGSLLQPGQIYNSSSYFLQAAARETAIDIIDKGVLPDDPVQTGERVKKLLKERQDRPLLIVSTGAVSKGVKDFIPELATELGFRTLFHAVKIRPGKPLFVGVSENVIWMGLPGNPMSSLVGWYFFARHLLNHWAGLPLPSVVELALQETVQKPEDLTCFFRGKRQKDGSVLVAKAQGSGHFRASLDAGYLVVLPDGVKAMAAGTKVKALSLA